MKTLSVADAAHLIGNDEAFFWTIAPDALGRQLVESCKRYARYLKDHAFAASHSSALECVARAVGYPNWHAFHTLAQRVIDDFTPDQHGTRKEGTEDRLAPLVSAIPLLVKTSKYCAPTVKERVGLEKVAQQLAQSCNRPVTQLLDMLGKMNGADNWDLLLARRPENAAGPLYSFYVDGGGSGRFEVSAACSALIAQQDDLFQDFHALSTAEKLAFETHLNAVLDRRPDFLEGLLARTEVMRMHPAQHRRINKVFDSAIRQAEALIPKDFKGEISWGYTSNRFYHRLLYGYMVRQAFDSKYAKALALARRQLRLNKNDNLGIRMWLPVLLCADGQHAAADKACKKMTLGDGYTDSGVELVRAICHYGNKRYAESAESLYLALFMFPPLRQCLDLDVDELHEVLNDDANRRTVSPDPETLVDHYLCVAGNQGLRDDFSAWLNMPELALAESRLASEFHANWRKPNGSTEKWHKDIQEQAKLLSHSAVA